MIRPSVRSPIRLSIRSTFGIGVTESGPSVFQTACYTVFSERTPGPPPAMTQIDYYCFEVAA